MSQSAAALFRVDNFQFDLILTKGSQRQSRNYGGSQATGSRATARAAGPLVNHLSIYILYHIGSRPVTNCLMQSFLE